LLEFSLTSLPENLFATIHTSLSSSTATFLFIILHPQRRQNTADWFLPWSETSATVDIFLSFFSFSFWLEVGGFAKEYRGINRQGLCVNLEYSLARLLVSRTTKVKKGWI
jgi:hypothetical protein